MVTDATSTDDDPIPIGDPTGTGETWTKLTWSERLAILITLLVILAVTVPRLPSGICYDDAGDLQLASATLGIAHPPGYAGYVSIGWLLTLLPGVDPAYLVSLGCLAAGVVAIWLAVLTQVRLGVNAWLAGAIGVALTAQPRVWQNLLAPEVYGPTLAFLAGAAYLALRHAHTRRLRDLLIAALLFGVALANRPPVVFALPFFLIAGLMHRRGSRPVWRQVAGRAALAGGCLILPALYSAAFVWLRDTPRTDYNYIEQYNREYDELPSSDAGFGAKMQRLVWQVSGSQFRHMMGNTVRGVRSKLRWLRQELGSEHLATTIITLVFLVGGAVLAGRRMRAAAWLLAGMAAQSVVFVCAYRIYGQAADLLPLIWAMAVSTGVALSVLWPRESSRPRRLVAIGLLVVAGTWTALDAGNRQRVGPGADATAFVKFVDLATFPRDAVICSSWGTSPPLWYARCVLTGRRDIQIINASAGRWLELIAEKPDRPVFFTSAQVKLPSRGTLVPFRKLWRLEWVEGG
ncbi:MAG: DUF2723 domain-containing protein [bacterium]|nr:DUF2723 domain-containing protein [bacterium]